MKLNFVVYFRIRTMLATFRGIIFVLFVSLDLMKR